MTTKRKLLAIHRAVDKLLEHEMPAAVSDHVCDSLDSLALAIKEWDVDWSRKKADWENGVKQVGSIRRIT